MASFNSMNERLANEPILPLLIKLSIPAAVANIVSALYSVVDRWFIGRIPSIGTEALGGVGLTFPIIMLITAFSMLVGMGAAPRASIAMGAGEHNKAEKYLGNAVTMLVAIGVSIILLCIIFDDEMLKLFGASKETLPFAKQYLNIYVLGTVFMLISLGLNSFINAQGNTKIGMMTVIIGALINIILDPIFIFLLDLGIAGAAWATVISQFISALWVILFLISKKSSLKIYLKNLVPDKDIIFSSLSLGVSAFIFYVNESIVVIVINRLLIHYGGYLSDVYITCMSILSSINQIFFLPLKGIVQGAQPIVSFNRGSGNFQRIKNTVIYARIISIGCAVIMWSIFMIFPEKVAEFYTTDIELINMTSKAIRIMFCTIFMLGMQMINQNLFIAIGNAKYSFLFGIMRKVLLLIPLAFILPMVFGVWGIFAAEAVSNFITTIITYIVFTKYIKKLKQNMEH